MKSHFDIMKSNDLIRMKSMKKKEEKILSEFIEEFANISVFSTPILPLISVDKTAANSLKEIKR